jgi:putative membrane protein
MSYTVENIKWMNRIATVISILVLIVVVLMRKIKIESAIDFSFLPPFYSFLNALAAVVLVIAYFQIKNKNIAGHKRSMIIALSISLLFLVCYVVYHITTPETKYCGEGISRFIYFILLISHIVLAAVSFPFILFTFIRGYTMQTESHKKMARFVFPVWLYVCVTGPVCYLMLMPCYAN